MAPSHGIKITNYIDWMGLLLKEQMATKNGFKITKDIDWMDLLLNLQMAENIGLLMVKIIHKDNSTTKSRAWKIDQDFN
jgi:hypothetical protein